LIERERDREIDLVSGVNSNGTNPELKGTLKRAKVNGEFLFNVVKIDDDRRRQHN
jgi:hypothetical protein